MPVNFSLTFANYRLFSVVRMSQGVFLHPDGEVLEAGSGGRREERG